MSHVVFQVPMMFVFHEVAPYIGIRTDAQLPSVSKIIMGVVFSFFVEDFYFYWVHRLLHWGVWYKYIHKIHHEYAAPIGMAAEYAHPLETLLLGFGTMLGPFLTFDHIFTIYVFLFFRLYQTIEHHCAYEYPWSPSKWLPLWSGAQFHDYHHETFVRPSHSLLHCTSYDFTSHTNPLAPRSSLETTPQASSYGTKFLARMPSIVSVSLRGHSKRRRRSLSKCHYYCFSQLL